MIFSKSIFRKMLGYLVVFMWYIGNKAQAQNIQWMSGVAAYSSEKILPQTGHRDYKTQPAITSSPNNGAFLEVIFDNPMPIKQLVFKKGIEEEGIRQIVVTDNRQVNHTLYQKDDSWGSFFRSQHFLHYVIPSPTPYMVQKVRLVMNPNSLHTLLPSQPIGISTESQVKDGDIRVATDAPTEIIRENMGKAINSRHQEFAPVISSDGNTLYYTRNYVSLFGKGKDQDIWFSTKDAEGNWTKAQSLGIPLNNEDDNAVFAISADGREVLLLNTYLKNGKMSAGISRSYRKGNEWSFPEDVKIDNFYNYNPYADFTLSSDGNVMVMSIQRNFTQGKRDLYVSFRKSTNEWTEPRNMGTVINTSEHEVTPFIAADGKTLYFSTRGFPGYGDNDIFKTQRLDDTWLTWSEPENLGKAINTPNWDGFFTLPAKGDYAYMCTYNTAAEKEDIYRLLLPQAARPEPVYVWKGDVLSTTDQKAISCEIQVFSLNNTSKNILANYDPMQGKFQLILPLQQAYQVVPRKKGYLAISEWLDLRQENTYREERKNLYMMPLEAGNKAVLNSLSFAQGSSVLSVEAMQDLQRIAQAMKEIPSLEVLFEGHTDNQGDFYLNLQLSEERVKQVKNYLIKQGIAEHRIQTKGWGPARPIASNATEEKRKLNRRVEFTVTKK